MIFQHIDFRAWNFMNIVDYHRGSRGQPPNLVDWVEDLGSKTPPSVGGADPLGKVGGVGTYQGGKWRPTGWIWRSFHGKILEVIETPANFGFGVSKVSHGQESICFGPKSWRLVAFFGMRLKPQVLTPIGFIMAGSSYTRNLDRKYMFLGVWNDCQQQRDQDVFFSHVAAGDHRALGRDGRDG